MMLRATTRNAATATALVLASAAAYPAELLVEWAPLSVAVESYQVERRVDDPSEAFRSIARVSGDATRFSDRSVLVGVRYCYRVRGVRGDRVSPSSPELCSVATERTPEPAPALEEAAPLVAPLDTSPRALEVRDAQAMRRPPPRYPQEAQLAGISGWVKLRFTVAADGTTKDIQVVLAEPPGVFDAAAIEAAQRFLYSPRTEGGVPVDRPNVETEITFTWIDRGGALVTDPRRRERR